ncbi:MAG: hypothetical protein JRN52_15005 [Nitrososphaerota archaeon]|nr:hypothetical protein [Nitrososphaerota archaeon]
MIAKSTTESVSSEISNALARKNASRVGFWSAVVTTTLAAAFFVIGILTPARSGPFCTSSCIPYPYETVLASFVPSDYIWLYPGLLLAPIFVVLLVSIHHTAPPEKKIFSQIGISFALIYASTIMIDYFVQFVVVAPSITSGQTSGLSLFTQYNPHGFFIGLEGLAYLMMSASFLSIAPVFAGGKLQSSIRWLFVGSFVLVISAFIAFSLLKYDIVAFEVTVLTINWIVLIASGSLLAVLFKRSR